MSQSSEPNAASPSFAQSPSAEDAPLASVIIPHYNDLENLRVCLNLLAAQTAPASSYEIIVADNNSRCGIDAVKSVCGEQARVVPAPIQGAAEARNAAVRASRGKILAFIDSDCRPKPQWLEEGIKALDSADVIGGQVDVDYEDPDHPTAVEAFEKVFAFDFKKYIEKDKFSGSGNMFVLRSIFDKVGDFRSGVSEDREWGNRAVSKGFSLKFAPAALVSHPARRNWEELTGKWRRLSDQTFQFKSARPYNKLRWMIYCFAVLLSPLVHFIKILRCESIEGLKLKLSAVVILFRIRIFRFFYGFRELFN
jgi:glycosyltransferase involved in cell wall biosynthesis